MFVRALRLPVMLTVQGKKGFEKEEVTSIIWGKVRERDIERKEMEEEKRSNQNCPFVASYEPIDYITCSKSGKIYGFIINISFRIP